MEYPIVNERGKFIVIDSVSFANTWFVIREDETELKVELDNGKFLGLSELTQKEINVFNSIKQYYHEHFRR
jgi:hypothetical protein